MSKLFYACCILWLSILFIGCSKKDTWQVAWYDNWLENWETYGPVFDTYEWCKDFALSKLVDYNDYSYCAKNCHSSIGDTPICEDAVRSWEIYPGSNVFENI